ncbi:hypothetical protein DFQ28_008465 [Apophysomyces sp. BC1034]|nr:hypothetical protein DFQ28_008465 [Apophysomyces sp. BC1034]
MTTSGFYSEKSATGANELSEKVKVYYSVRGNAGTRLSTFSMPFNPNHKDIVPIPLRNCLWAICSSSPDIICRVHDLSIYAVNFQESGPSDQRESLIWEGHGLLSWILEREDSSEIKVYGKLKPATDGCDRHIDIHIELHPTLRWVKDDFYNALRSQNFECFRNASRSPVQNHSCSCSINLPWAATSTNETEFDKYLKQRQRQSPTLPALASPTPRLPPPHGMVPSAVSSSQIYRPEPIFPNTSVSPNLDPYKRSPPTAAESRKLYPTEQTPRDDPYRHEDRFHLASSEKHRRESNDRTLPHPAEKQQQQQQQQQQQWRSAFTPTEKDGLGQASSPSSSSSSTFADKSSGIPVIYTPSNKKRKKNPSSIPSDVKSSTQVSTVVRTFYEVDKDDRGNYILPVEIDSWTVVDLGTVIYDRPAYHNQRYIYPANYTVRKWYRSMVDPKSDTQYTCRILENGKEPKFEVTADDCPMTYSGPTPTTVWTIIVRRAFAIRNQEYGHNPVGPDFFGLRKNTIAKMIQDLPNASQCSQYVWQSFEPARFNKPGRNRRRTDPMLPGGLYGGVNYSLTSSRLLSVASGKSDTQNQDQLDTQQQEFLPGSKIAPHSTTASPPTPQYSSSPPASSLPSISHRHSLPSILTPASPTANTNNNDSHRSAIETA